MMETQSKQRTTAQAVIEGLLKLGGQLQQEAGEHYAKAGDADDKMLASGRLAASKKLISAAEAMIAIEPSFGDQLQLELEFTDLWNCLEDEISRRRLGEDNQNWERVYRSFLGRVGDLLFGGANMDATEADIADRLEGLVSEAAGGRSAAELLNDAMKVVQAASAYCTAPTELRLERHAALVDAVIDWGAVHGGPTSGGEGVQ